ncbi:DUF350 domain-containing protein [Oceanirhabdus sp. W0125-5]|uniref:DUF350 domain-containing protein n=1 Tax=Oceanirhabdus sp. W0125-5 TaxID=2999116 RepID=UPI0022F33948|nr:DUF350 domain-containing protein [Oceanirhabdus sp. W0125-5]WBW95898.1 DUF350 domain-containing protein [Oceanirhabdus sp. W0125-5]
MDLGNILNTAMYGLIGLLLMMVGYTFFDMVTPFKFADEIKEKNAAVGAMIGGIFIAVAVIVTAVIR